MTFEVMTDTPQFRNDLGEILRLFYGANADVSAPAPSPCDATFVQKFSAAEGLCAVHCRLEHGGRTYERTLTQPLPQEADALVEKRIIKRTIKRCAYLLLKEFSGARPPWGALTGVRPSRVLYTLLEDGLTLSQAREEMLSTYDVSEEKLSLLMEIEAVQRDLLVRDEQSVDVYIGIPFCTTRCHYCSFAAGEIGDGKQVEPYLSALFREMDAVGHLVREGKYHLRSLYIGGGTPTALSAAQLARLTERMHMAFPGAQEITVEAGRPDTITAPKLDVLQNARVSRICVNPQTMNDATLMRIGRAHTAQDVVRAFELAREKGFTDINMDVICGLQGEGQREFAHTMAQIKALNPEGLTVHTLALKHSSRLYDDIIKGKTQLQVQEDISGMVDLGRETAGDMGMVPYYLYRQKYMAGSHENVGYAKPGKYCRYNVDIMEETTSILALGAGGISKRAYKSTKKRIKRAPNVSNIDNYIARVDEMIARKRDVFLQAPPQET